MKMIITSLMALLFATTCSAQNQINPTEKAQSFRAGGKSITIPAPVEMVEVGYENREVMEIFI